MNPNEINKLKEKAPFPIIILVLLLFIPAFLIEPESFALNENAQNYDLLLKRCHKNMKNRERYREENEKSQKLTQVYNQIESQLPEAAKMPAIIDRIDLVARQNDVLIDDVSYSINKTFDGLEVPSFNISMNLKAYYQDMRKFVTILEGLDFPMVIAEIVASQGQTYRIILKQLVK
jgi:Tfp pilus assembly protein PilO